MGFPLSPEPRLQLEDACKPDRHHPAGGDTEDVPWCVLADSSH